MAKQHMPCAGLAGVLPWPLLSLIACAGVFAAVRGWRFSGDVFCS